MLVAVLMANVAVFGFTFGAGVALIEGKPDKSDLLVSGTLLTMFVANLSILAYTVGS